MRSLSSALMVLLVFVMRPCNADPVTPVLPKATPKASPVTLARQQDDLRRFPSSTHADQCIEHGQTCTLNGTECCDASDICTGKFPNTTCQAKQQ